MDNVNKEESMVQQNLKGKIYKLLPIYEGKQLNNDIIIDKQTAYNNFQRNVNMLALYLVGMKNRYGLNQYIENILLLIEGLKTIGIDNHNSVKNTVFACIKLATRMSEQYGLNGLDIF